MTSPRLPSSSMSRRWGVTSSAWLPSSAGGDASSGRTSKLTRRRPSPAADSATAVVELAEAARAVAVQIGVLVDVNVGLPRCGIAPGEPALELARRGASTEGLRLCGLMGYEGHAVAIADRTAREAAARYAMEPLLSTAQMVREAGLPCDIGGGGGTGTHDT